ncbi:hypothetical protein E4U73_07475 [Escherichia coli O157:H7]|nr:hypothetical protein E4U73_07475 [Escherichia coli O157:H7]
MTDLGGKTCIFSHPVYLFLREFSLQDSRGGSECIILSPLFESGKSSPLPEEVFVSPLKLFQ